MKKQTGSHTTPVPEDAYTRDYYETCCHGYEEFKFSKGGVIPLRLSFPLNLAKIQSGMKVLDIGCGRGEIVLHCAHLGAITWGLDYADEALKLAHEVLVNQDNRDYVELMAIQKSISYRLPFANESIDVVFMLDIVEHLTPEQLNATFDEVHRILRRDGRLIIHTMPNLWYYRIGYPIYRFLQRLRGEKLPADPRARWSYSYVHINEQTPHKLSETLKKRNFHTKIWLYSVQNYDYEPNPIVRSGMSFLTRIYPFRWVFCNDIFAVGSK